MQRGSANVRPSGIPVPSRLPRPLGATGIPRPSGIPVPSRVPGAPGIRAQRAPGVPPPVRPSGITPPVRPAGIPPPVRASGITPSVRPSRITPPVRPRIPPPSGPSGIPSVPRTSGIAPPARLPRASAASGRTSAPRTSATRGRSRSAQRAPATVTGPATERAPSPVRRVSPERAVSPLRRVSPERARSPVRIVSPERPPSPVRRLSPERIVSPVRDVAHVTVPSPVILSSPPRAVSPVKPPVSPVKPASPTVTRSPASPRSPIGRLSPSGARELSTSLTAEDVLGPALASHQLTFVPRTRVKYRPVLEQIEEVEEEVAVGAGPEPEGPGRASQVTLAEAEVLCAVMASILATHCRTLEVFLFKDDQRSGSYKVNPYADMSRKPFAKGSREVFSRDLHNCYGILLTWRFYFRDTTRLMKECRERARREHGDEGTKFMPALTNEDYHYISDLWKQAIKGFNYVRKVFRDYCREAVREEISFCYALIDENKKDMAALRAEGRTVSLQRTRFMNDWANYLRIAQLLGEFTPDSLRLDCVYDVCDTFRLVCENYLGAFIRKTAWHFANVLDVHTVEQSRAYKWAEHYKKREFRWDHDNLPIWSPRLIFNALIKATEILGVCQLTHYNMIRTSLAYVSKYVYGNKGNLWQKQIITVLCQEHLADSLLECHQSLGRLLPVLVTLSNHINEAPQKLFEHWHSPTLESLATKEVFDYWKDSSKYSEKLVNSRNQALVKLLWDEYSRQDELMTAEVKNFALKYISVLSTKRKDLPEFFEGPLFKMYQQVMYIYEGMHQELVTGLGSTRQKNIWLLELPRRGFVFLKLVTTFVIDSLSAQNATTRKPDDAYPKFIMGRMPMPEWARSHLLDHYAEESHKEATARLRAEEEKYRKRTGRVTIPAIIKLRPIKSPEKPKDLPENPPPWRKRTKPMGPHFWPERVPCKWLLPGITLSDWNTPQGMMQMKYESEDMTETVFRSLLMEAIHREMNKE